MRDRTLGGREFPNVAKMRHTNHARPEDCLPFCERRFFSSYSKSQEDGGTGHNCSLFAIETRVPAS